MRLIYDLQNYQLNTNIFEYIFEYVLNNIKIKNAFKKTIRSQQ